MMVRLFPRTKKQSALSPGTVEYVGERKVDAVRVQSIAYDAGSFDEQTIASIDECFPLQPAPGITWINVDGLHDTALLQTLADRVGLHPLVVEDIVSRHERPKLEDYQDYLFVALRALEYNETTNEITTEQLSLVLGPNYVFSFQEVAGDGFDPVRERIRKGKGRMRGMGPDYLAYALIDAIVDDYFVLLERIGERIETLEDALMEQPTREHLHGIHELKREMIILRRSVWPLREVVGRLERGESGLIRRETHVFLRDLYDHTIQVIDGVESYRDMLTSLQDLYLSSVSNKLNEVMKVLTIIATLFIPVSFFAGVFGMNFDYMPELRWKWSYPIFWFVILCALGGMLTWFRRRRWL
jgi:magnesium transporter